MKKTIGELCFLHSGGTPSTKHPEYWGGTLPWLSSSESGKGFIYSSNVTITEEGVKNSATKLAKKGSIIIATAGEGKTRGQVSVLEIDAYINQSLIAINPKNEEIDSLFLYYYLKNSYNALRSLSDATGVRGSLSGELLKTFVIEYPDIKVQRRIGQILRKIDLKIETNKALLSELYNTVSEIYGQWFIQCDFLTDEKQPYKASGGEMRKDESLGRLIPVFWEVKTLADVLEVLKDGTHNPPARVEDGVPLLTGTMFGEFFLNYEAATKVSIEDYKTIHAKYAPKCGDFIVTKIGTLGSVNYLDETDIPITIHCNSALLRFQKEFSRSYAFCYLKSEEFYKRIKAAKGQSIQEFVSLDKLGDILILVPDKKTLDKFENVTKELINEMVRIRNEINELESLKHFIIPSFMSGQLKFE